MAEAKRSGMAAIDVKGHSKSFGAGNAKIVALDAVSLVIGENEFFTLLARPDAVRRPCSA